MNHKKLAGAGLRTGKNLLLAITVVALAFGCRKSNNVNNNDLRDFNEVVLVANEAKYNPITLVDPTLINAFGIAWSPNGIAWVNSVGGHVSELYRADGSFVKRVNIPTSAIDTTSTTSGLPCGIVFSGGKNFRLPDRSSAAFLFTGFDGVLSGWSGGDNAQFLKHPPKASYTGLAIGASGGKNFIYGANFGQKKIDVWDTAISRITTMSFKDPTLPAEYSPYNIQAVGDWLFVMYGQLDTVGAGAGHAVAGAGKGFVSVFNTDGSFVKRFASQGTLNVPWGVTMAPASFLDDKDMGDDNGGYGDKSYGGGNNNNKRGNRDPKDPVILVGNFGDGHINVFSQEGKFLGQLQSHKHPIFIDGLWALSFNPAATDQSKLYFTAGPEGETDGLFGYLTKQ